MGPPAQLILKTRHADLGGSIKCNLFMLERVEHLKSKLRKKSFTMWAEFILLRIRVSVGLL